MTETVCNGVVLEMLLLRPTKEFEDEEMGSTISKGFSQAKGGE